MKPSISIGSQQIQLPQIVFRASLSEAFSAAKTAGFDAVDLFLYSCDEISKSTLRKLSDDHCIHVALFSAFGDLSAKGISLGSPDAALLKEFFRLAPYHLEIAAELGSIVPVGFSRGVRKTDETHEEYVERLSDSIRRYDALAGEFGVRLAIEPINRYEINSLNTVGEALSMIEAGNLSHTGLLLDLFHMNIEEVSITTEIVRSFAHVFHIHFTDSNRCPPGMGHMNLKDIYILLRGLGYDGYLAIESLPYPTSQTAAKLGLEYFSMLERQAKVFYA